MSHQAKFRAFINQIKKFRLPLLIFLLFWLAGIVTLYIIEPDKSFGRIMLISMGILQGSSVLFSGFYQFLWPLMFELLILSFILTTLQEFYGYNPLLNARKLASHQKDHTVVLGYNHLGMRIVDYLMNKNQPYSLIEIDFEKVEDLITFNQPIVVGDYTDKKIMRLAGIEHCKEVFCVTTDLRRALIAADRVRDLNKKCCLYMRVFDEHFRDYLTSEPWNAFTFSTSKWTMESVKIWGESIDKEGCVVVLGNDSIVTRIVDYFGEELQIKTYLLDPEIDPEVYNDLPNVLPYNERVQFVENLEERIDLKSVSQMYICWKTNELFSDAIILAAAIKQDYPHIQLFVRMFDEELAEIAKAMKATTFSTSAFAFKMLQKEVQWNSGIYPKQFTKKKKSFWKRKKYPIN